MVPLLVERMTVGRLLFSFTGRIGRAPYWITSISLAIAAVVLSFVVVVVIGLTSQGRLTEREFMIALSPWTMGLFLMLCYPAAAIVAKRLQDRDKPGWLAALLFVPMLISVVFEPSYWGGRGTIAQLIAGAAGVISALVGIWFLIELGFLRGSVGANRFGPDPLDRSARS